MARIVLQSAGNAAKIHFNNTIKNNIELDNIKDFLSQDSYTDLIKIYPNKKVKIWGSTAGESNVKNWKALCVGDINLFASKGIIGQAIVTYKLRNSNLAEFLWGRTSNGATWEYIYFVDEFKNLDISYDLFNEILGYSRTNVVRGFRILKQEISDNLISALELSSSNFLPTVSEDTFIDSINAQFTGALDRKVETKQRQEQDFLRKNLFGDNKIAKCAICGKEYPINLLITSHIKKRSLCTREERLDSDNIVTPMCRFGCDELFEKGYIYVENGEVKVNSNREITDDLRAYLTQIEGNRCLSYNENTKKYYEQHKIHHNII